MSRNRKGYNVTLPSNYKDLTIDELSQKILRGKESVEKVIKKDIEEQETKRKLFKEYDKLKIGKYTPLEGIFGGKRKTRRNRKGGRRSATKDERINELTRYLNDNNNEMQSILRKIIIDYLDDRWSFRDTNRILFSSYSRQQWENVITNLINNNDELRWTLDDMGRRDIELITLRRAWFPYAHYSLGGGKRKTRRNRKGGYSDGPIKHFEPFENLEQAQEVLTRHLTVIDNRHVTRFLIDYLKYYIKEVWNHHPRWTRRKWEDDINDEIMGYNGEDNFMVDVSTYDADNIYDYDQLFGAWIPFPRHRVPYGQGGKKRKSRKSKKGKKRLTKRHRK